MKTVTQVISVTICQCILVFSIDNKHIEDILYEQNSCIPLNTQDFTGPLTVGYFRSHGLPP